MTQSPTDAAAVPATVAGEEQVTHLVLRGALDAASAGDVARAAREAAARERPVRVVMADASAIDTATLQVLLALRQAGAAAGWPVSIEQVPSGPMDSITVAGCAAALGLDDRTLSH